MHINLDSMDPNKACEFDGILAILFKICALELAPCFPASWKSFFIALVFKNTSQPFDLQSIVL